MRRVVIVGAGIVGLCCAYSLLRSGYHVVVVDRDPAGDKASFGNAGGIAVPEVLSASSPAMVWRLPKWVLDPLGPVFVRPSHAPRLLPWMVRFLRAGGSHARADAAAALFALNELVYPDLLAVLNDIGLSSDLHRAGALYVYRTRRRLNRDCAAWKTRKFFGIECQLLSGDEARELEPALSRSVEHAVFTPAWSHVSDPKRIVDVLRGWLLSQGARIEVGEVTAIIPIGTGQVEVQLRDLRSLNCDVTVVAAGAWSGQLASTVGDRVVMESERGYNGTLPNPAIELSREIVFAEDHFVATPMSVGLRIGGAAEFAGLFAPPNFTRVTALLALAEKYLPGLCLEGCQPWMGHRPATPDSLPVIGPSPHCPNIVYAFGHGHLGLTQAAITGRLIKEICGAQLPSIDLHPFRIERFS